MGMWYRIKTALARFMYGRNGADQLTLALLWGYLILAVVRAVLSMTLDLAVLDLLMTLLLWAVLIFMLLRIFSRNTARRQAENQRWINWTQRFRGNLQGARARRADKAHKYFTCKNCKTICRVPAGKGKIVITCPKCGAQIHGKS